MSTALATWLIGMSLGGVSLVLLALAFDAWRLKMTPTPSGRRARRHLIALCAREICHVEKTSLPQVFDLGSGWGGLCLGVGRALNRERARCDVIGYELGRVPHGVSRASLALLRLVYRCLNKNPLYLARCNLRRGDLIDALAEVREGDVCLCYLCPEQMQRIADELDTTPQDLGITLISLVFALPRHTPHTLERLSGVFKDPIYVYKV